MKYTDLNYDQLQRFHDVVWKFDHAALMFYYQWVMEETDHLFVEPLTFDSVMAGWELNT